MALHLSDYNYDLPKELIAQTAVSPKSYSRLMVVMPDRIEHQRFFQIKEWLRPGDVMVVNRSKVMKNKLTGHKSTGAAAEMIVMKPVDEYRALARIKCSRVRVGNRFLFDDLEAVVEDQDQDVFTVTFDRPVETLIDRFLYPNPPYIHRTVGEEYQTVYAHTPGSLAAPTAGLHFTPHLIRSLKQQGVRMAEVILHVGFGTFLPIRDEDVTGHRMEPEYYEIDNRNADLINGAQRLIVVGTTTFKALQTSARGGREVQSRREFSDLFIYPGIDLPLEVDGLITNFHLPKSTLLLLVSAYMGRERILQAYQEAVERRYRFFSLGDATFLLKQPRV